MRFHDMRKGEKGRNDETFVEFTRRFRLAAALSIVRTEYWFNASVVVKYLWKADFNEMVASLTSFEFERHWNLDLERRC